MMMRWTVPVGEEDSCCVRFWITVVNGDICEFTGRIGIKLMAVGSGSVSRFVRSKVWQKTAGDIDPRSPGSEALWFRFGVVKAIAVSKKMETGKR